jgi:cytochrome c biogenesis factor
MNNTNRVLLVVYNVLFFCGIALSALLAIPLFIGAFDIIYQNGDIPSASASIELAIAATALGAVVVWFAERSKSDKKTKSSAESDARNKIAESSRRSIIAVGIALIFAAICFILFGLLSPILPDAIKAHDFFSTIVKWAGVLSLMAGSISLGFALCVGIFDVWFWHIGR